MLEESKNAAFDIEMGPVQKTKGGGV